MAVLRTALHSASKVPAWMLAARASRLNHAFGQQPTSALVTSYPHLLWRRPDTIVANFHGARELLGLDVEQALGVFAKCPMLLIQRPAALRFKMQRLQQTLQVSSDNHDGCLLAVGLINHSLVVAASPARHEELPVTRGEHLRASL